MLVHSDEKAGEKAVKTSESGTNLANTDQEY
jgi:hypothetical protein